MTAFNDKTEAERLFNHLRSARTEQAKKERFLQYLTSIYRGDKDAQDQIATIALGAEASVFNVKRGDKIARGRADVLTDTVIIEWEKDLSKTGDHAAEQLREYLSGNWQVGEDYGYVLVATDGIEWRRFAPDWSKIPLEGEAISGDFDLREVGRFTLSDQTFEDFPFFLDALLFASQLRVPTLESIQSDFGDTSRVFINSIAALRSIAKDLDKEPEMQVAYEQWRRFLSVAYGRFDDSKTLFLVHTYLSVFAKFIAYSVLTKTTPKTDLEVKEVLNGVIFNQLNIERFVEDDFFHWVAAPKYIKKLSPMFKEISRQLEGYSFVSVKEDILKGVYQELIDLETRHALGEYYTPDWLCERILDAVNFASTATFLDPACGSGSFLRAIISSLQEKFRDLEVEKIAEQVVGIDIHPLSVLISKTTVLLALGDTVRNATNPVVLHVYLANSLLVPHGAADLLGSNFQVSVDNKSYSIDLAGIDSPEAFDEVVDFCNGLVESHPSVIERARFIIFADTIFKEKISASQKGQVYDLYLAMKMAKDAGRDSIWKFILQNSYKPIFLMNKFDFVFGNPPWLTYSSVSNAEYQNLLKQLSDRYMTTPGRANMPHLEIAAIFLAHATNYFLKQSGTLAFVLPRSFLTADQHENTRSGTIRGVKIASVWDLRDVDNLFRVPSCVLFCNPNISNKPSQLPTSGVSGFSFSGRLPRAQINWSEAKLKLSLTPVQWYYAQLAGPRGRRKSALTTNANGGASGTNFYTSLFAQGATIVPRNLFFVEITQDIPIGANIGDRVWAVRTSPDADESAKVPWKGKKLSGRTEGKHLFKTALSRTLVPFKLVDPPIVMLPVRSVIESNGKSAFEVLNSEKLMEIGSKYASAWFSEAEAIWRENRTDRNRSDSVELCAWLDWQKKLSSQRPSARYLVLYTSSSKDASAAIIDCSASDLPFIVDHKAYWYEAASLDEAYYLCAFINSDAANVAIKDFQSRGLFGPRDIHKTILKVPLPRYKQKSPSCLALSALGRVCEMKVSDFLASSPPMGLSAASLGKLRSALRKHLSKELVQIDAELNSLWSSSRGLNPRRKHSAQELDLL